MEFLSIFLPTVLYMLGIAALVVLIILGIRLIGTLDKVDKLIDDANRVVGNVEEKVNSLNSIFSVINKTTDSIMNIGTTVVGAVQSAASKVFNRNKDEDKEEFSDE